MNDLREVLLEVAGYMDDKCGEECWYLDDGEDEYRYDELINILDEQEEQDEKETEDTYWEDRYTWQYARGGANVYRIGDDGFKTPNPIFMARRYEDDGYPGWMPWEFGAMNR